MAYGVLEEQQLASRVEARRIEPIQWWSVLYTVGLAAFVLLNVGDVITTLVAIDRGCTELNPVVAPLLSCHDHLFIVVKLAAVALFVVVFERARRRVGRYLPFQVGSLLFLCALYLVAVCVNLSAW